jgi:4-hydroxybenzoate polyprenyltransferase
LAANLIDLKDTAGDRAARILTLPVLLGQRAAQWVLACALAGFFAFLPLAFRGQVPWAPMMAFACLAFFLVSRRKYDERPLFLVIVACECFVFGSLLRR